MNGKGGRFVAFGANPLHDIARTSQSGGTANVNMDRLIQNAIKWLNNGVNPNNTINYRVTTAHLSGASSYWFSHDITTTNYIKQRYPNATINGINTCDNYALANCLQNTTLLIISRQMGRNDDTASNSATTDVSAIKLAVAQYSLNGGSVMFVDYYREDNDLSIALFDVFGMNAATTNYWQKAKALNVSATYINSITDSSQSVIDAYNTVVGKTPLVDADMAPCINAVASWGTSSCGTASFKSKLSTGLSKLRSDLSSLDNSGIDLFGVAGSKVTKLLVLLGDKYRQNVTDAGTIPLSYFFSKTSYDRFAAAAFSDSSVLYIRKDAPAQTDVGNLYCSKTTYIKKTCEKYQNYTDRVPIYNKHVVNQTVLFADTWTSTGLFALPGKTISVRRLDSNTQVSLSVRFWFQREGVGKSFYVDNTYGTFDYLRPQFGQSTSVSIPSNGRSVQITSRVGGPVYLVMSNTAAYSSADPKPSSLVEFSNVAKHPAILDMTNQTQVQYFVQDIKTNPLPAIDLKGDGFEVHARKDKLLESLKPLDKFIDYSGSNGMDQLLYDYRYNFVETVYSLAGFKLVGRTLNQTLPAWVLQTCNGLGWDCTNEVIHRRQTVQHSNYDNWANCGNDCSGNPWDADWGVQAIGWGESHELGHTLQRSELNIAWVNAADSRDNWGKYQNRAGENSNNIFPYNTKWRYYRWYKNYNDTDVTNLNYKESFAAIQSALYNKTAMVGGVLKRVVLSPSCSVWKSYAIDTPTSQVIYDAMYSDGSYAADNDYRVAFYTHLALMLEGQVMRDGTTLQVGMDIFTFMYIGGRLFQTYAANEATWNANRASLGFGMFNRTGHATYNGNSVQSIPGNDFLLVFLSYLTNKDMRPYYDVRGVAYTSLASAQVQDHIDNGRITGVMTNDYAVWGNAYPPKVMSTLPKVKLDGVSAWPLDNWSAMLLD